MQTAPLPLPPTDSALSGSATAHPPRVFISYSHDSPEHADRVLDLADRLRRDGIEATIDQYIAWPPEGWPAWMDRQIDESDFVLLVCTETYYRRVMGREEPGKGLGVRWEGMLVYQHIYDAAGNNIRFIPVLFEPRATEYIPRPVKGASYYPVDTDDGYEGLYRCLTTQPITPPPVSPQLRQWRREPGQADRFADLRRRPGVIIQPAGDGRSIVAGQPHLTLARWHGRRRRVGSPLDLLNPFSRAIPLIGREAEMADLRAWLAGEAPIAARCLVGRAGVGKTRLAIELCEWAESREWRAGFIEAKELARFLDQQNLAVWGWQEPTLAVIDGAAGAARVLRQWLVELANNPGAPGRPLRLLLLERHADRDVGWWHDLVTPRSFQEDGLPDLFDPPEPYLLASIGDEADRHRLAATAASAAAALKDQVQPVHGLAEGDRPRFRVSPVTEPLVLLMDAVTASGEARGRTELAQRLAQFELGRIEALAEDRQLKGEFLCHMAGFVTLTGGLALDRLVDTIAGEQAALRWQGAGDAPEVAEALRDALGEIDGEGGRVVPPVLPELIGEALITAALQKQAPETQTAIVRRARAAGGRRCTASVVRTAQDFAGKDHPALLWLDALVEDADEPAELMAISDQLPERTVCMIERAAAIEKRLVEAQRTLSSTDESAGMRLTLAGCLTRLATRLRDLCRFEDALAAAMEAVAIHRALSQSEERPSSTGDFAQALLHLSGAAADLGRREEALGASAEAVGLLRRESQPSRASLARALSIMASHLSNLGRRDEALSAAEESVGLHREIAAARSDAETPTLALSLLNLAYCRHDVGRSEDALAAAEESVQHLAGAARTKPDAFLSVYAQALNSAAVYLAHTGRLSAALDSSREAIAIQRSLAEGCAEAYQPDMALMLNGYANALRQTGDIRGALAALEEAVALLRGLAAERPDAHLPELAKQLNNQSLLLVANGQVERAVHVASEAVAIFRDAAARRPDRHDDDLATALVCLAFANREAGKTGEMLDCAMQSVAIRRQLAERWPTAFRPRLARSLVVLTEALKLCGRDAEAETTSTEAAGLAA